MFGIQPRRLCLALMMAFTLAGISTSHAAIMSVSATQPTLSGDDIAQLVQVNESWNETSLDNNRPARGQAFMTGAFAGGYELSSLTLRAYWSGINSGNAGSYTIRVGTISGTNFSLVQSEAVIGVILAADDYVTFTFDTPVALNPNTLYGVDVGKPNSGAWSHWFNTNVGSYPDGYAYSSGSLGVGNNVIVQHTGDRVFILDIAQVPEPASLVLLGLGSVLMFSRRR